MKTAFVVKTRDGKPFMLISSSTKGSTFKPLSDDAKNLAKAFSDEYKESAITKAELNASLDTGMTVQGPMPESAVASAIESGTKTIFETSETKFLPVISVSDAPIYAFSEKEFNNVITYKTLAFIGEQQKTTFNYEVKRVRALWDPGLSIPGTNRRGGWRCPTGTRYGGQITDRFGRNCGWGVARRIANAISNIGERLESVDDRKRNRRVERRNQRMIARLQNQERPGRIEQGLRGVAERLEGGESAPQIAPASRQIPEIPQATVRPQGQRRRPTQKPVEVPAAPARPRARRRGATTARLEDRRDAGLRDSERRRVRREIEQPGAPRTDEVPARRPQREADANRRRLNLLENESDAVLRDMLNEMRQDPDYKDSEDYKQVMREIRRRQRLNNRRQPARPRNGGNLRDSEQRRIDREIEQPGAPRTDEAAPAPARPARPRRRRASEQRAEQTATRRPEAEAPAVEVQPQRPVKKQRAAKRQSAEEAKTQVANILRDINFDNEENWDIALDNLDAKLRELVFEAFTDNPEIGGQVELKLRDAVNLPREKRNRILQEINDIPEPQLLDDEQWNNWKGANAYRFRQLTESPYFQSMLRGTPQERRMAIANFLEQYARAREEFQGLRFGQNRRNALRALTRRDAAPAANAVEVPNEQELLEIGNKFGEFNQIPIPTAYQKLVEIRENLDKRRLSQLINASFPTAEEVLLRDELQNYNRDIFRALETTQFTRINDWVNNRNEADLTNDESFAGYERNKSRDIIDKMNDAKQAMIQASTSRDPRQRQEKIKSALAFFDMAKQQGLELELMRQRRQRLLGRPADAPTPNAVNAPNTPRPEAPAAPAAPQRFTVAQVNARIANAINAPNDPIRELDLPQLRGLIENIYPAERTGVRQQLETQLTRLEQNFEAEKQNRIAAINRMNDGTGIQGIIDGQTTEKRNALEEAQEFHAVLIGLPANASPATRQRALSNVLESIYKAKLADFRVQNAQRRASELNVQVRIPAPPVPALRPQPINFEQVKNAPRANNGMDAISKAVEDAAKAAIAQETVAARRAEAQQRWDLIKRDAANNLVAYEENAVKKLSELRTRNHRKEMEARARGNNVAFNSKEEAQQKLQEAQEALVAITSNPNDFLLSRNQGQIVSLITQASRLKQTVDNWDADSAIIERATNPNATKYFDPDAPESQQKRQALGNIGDVLKRNIDAAIDKRQNILNKYLDETWGDNEPYQDMTPARWRSLTAAEQTEYIKKAYTLQKFKGANGKYYQSTVRVTKSGSDFDVGVTFDEVDENGTVIRNGVATSYRTVTPRTNSVYNNSMGIGSEADKGSGIATIYNQHAFYWLSKIGIERANVTAVNDGAFVWARIGYKRGAPSTNGFSDELARFEKFGPGGLISNQEEYWKIKYLVQKSPPATHQEFILALASSSVSGGRGSSANAREQQIKEWFKRYAGFGGGTLSFAEQKVGQRRRGAAVAQPVASTPRRTRVRRTAGTPQ